MFDGDDIAKMIFGGMGRGFGRGWGKRRHWGGGMGGLGGWVIPAMIIGRIIEEATRQKDSGQWDSNPAPSPSAPPPPPQPRTATVPPSPFTEATPAPAPAAPTPRRECRYCGREMPAGAHSCIGCGAPQHLSS